MILRTILSILFAELAILARMEFQSPRKWNIVVPWRKGHQPYQVYEPADDLMMLQVVAVGAVGAVVTQTKWSVVTITRVSALYSMCNLFE